MAQLRGIDVLGQGFQRGISGFMESLMQILAEKRRRGEVSDITKGLFQGQSPTNYAPQGGVQNANGSLNPLVGSGGTPMFSMENFESLGRLGELSPQSLAALRMTQPQSQVLQGFRGSLDQIVEQPYGDASVRNLRPPMPERPAAVRPQDVPDVLLGYYDIRGPEGQMNRVGLYGPPDQPGWSGVQKVDANKPPPWTVTKQQAMNFGSPFKPGSGDGGGGRDANAKLKVIVPIETETGIQQREFGGTGKSISESLQIEKRSLEENLKPHTNLGLSLDDYDQNNLQSLNTWLEQHYPADGGPNDAKAQAIVRLVKNWKRIKDKETEVNLAGHGVGEFPGKTTPKRNEPKATARPKVAY